MYELKIRTTLRLVNRIKTLASERKISINKMAVSLSFLRKDKASPLISASQERPTSWTKSPTWMT
jgi:hypothetical protein